MSYSIRDCMPGESDKAIAFASQFKAIKDFGYNWRRWGNFEKQPPVLAFAGQQIIGIHAATISKRSGYINSYYLAVDGEWQGKGIAAAMIEMTLSHAASQQGLGRLKFKAHFESPGNVFWQGLGAMPFAQDKVQFLYDMHLGPNFARIETVIQWWKFHKDEDPPVPESSMARYRKAGVKFYA